MFRTLVAAADETAAIASIYRTIADDGGSMPLPRLIIRFMNSADALRAGLNSFTSKGSVVAFLQLDALTDAELRTKYELASDAAVTIEDHRCDLDNSMGTITDQLSAISADPVLRAGALETQKIEEFDCGLADPAENNGQEFYEMVWILHYEGQL